MHDVRASEKYPYLLRERNEGYKIIIKEVTMPTKNNPLMRLLDESGPSGFEQPIRTLISKEIKEYVDEVRIDKFGNLIAHKKGKKPAVIIVAHMDEIGLLIKAISEEGHIYTASVGGIEPMTLLGERVQLKTKKGTIKGIITTKEIHNGDDIKKIPALRDVYVDTGLNRLALTKLGVGIGDYIHIMQHSTFLGNEKIICGKALDDRLGCYILLELAKRLQKNVCDLSYVFTVQEEVGLYGAKTSVYSMDPDWALVIDTTNADDYNQERYTKQIGRGPCITVKDSEMIGNKCLNDIFKELSKKTKIPIQLEITDFGTTDALSISVAKGGIPTGMVSVPVRNIHTASGIAHLDDINNAVKLIEILLRNPPKTCVT